MNKTFTILALLAAAMSANAQTDSVSTMKRDMKEVVVKSDLAVTSAEKSTYYPSRRHKNVATDAVALLQHMMIPQLRINPNSLAVSTITGEEVAIFIDFMPATTEDLEGMNTQDVKRVDLYDYPSDVRFHGKQHVVNFVMQKYEVGGYTKLSTTEMVLADFSSVGSAYSKLAYKGWTFDANATGRFNNHRHNGAENAATFHLPSQTVTRNENSANGKLRKTTASASLRATYQSNTMQIANRFEFLDKNTPKQETTGNVSYSPTLSSTATSLSRQDSRSITPSYRGDWNFMLPKQWMLSVAPKFEYSRNTQNRFYREGGMQPIEYQIKEDVLQGDWEVTLGKVFAGKHNLLLGNYGLDYSSRLDYAGSTSAHQDMNLLVIGIPIIYKLHTQQFSYSLEAIACYAHDKVNSEVQDKWTPIIRTSATYAFNRKNALDADFSLSCSIADGAERNPSVLQTNELLYYCGNPKIDYYNNFIGKIQYTWMPSNLLSASAFVQHIYNRDYYANVWEPYNDGAAIIRRLENVGDAHTTNFGADVTLRLLDGNLQLSAYPRLSLIRVSGINHLSRNPFNMDVRASYYMGQFYFRAGYTSPEQQYYRESSEWRRERSFYYLSAGWGNNHWKAKLDIINPFRTDWRDVRTTIDTPLYSQTGYTLNSTSHQRINLTLTYTFGYGKKVKRGNELQEATGGQSSIL